MPVNGPLSVLISFSPSLPARAYPWLGVARPRGSDQRRDADFAIPIRGTSLFPSSRPSARSCVLRSPDARFGVDLRQPNSPSVKWTATVEAQEQALRAEEHSVG